MIRILHTADWHLGQTFFGYDRAEEHKAFLDWLAEEIRQNEIDALVIAGDVFDVSILLLRLSAYIMSLFIG